MKRMIYLVGAVALVFFLSTTNPSRADYVSWMKDKTLDESSNFLEKGIISVAGQTIFEAATTKKDYYIFSIYTTDFSDIGKGKIKYMGIFNQFIPIGKD